MNTVEEYLKTLSDPALMALFFALIAARTPEEKEFYKTLYMVGKMDEKIFWQDTMQMWNSYLFAENHKDDIFV